MPSRSNNLVSCCLRILAGKGANSHNLEESIEEKAKQVEWAFQESDELKSKIADLEDRIVSLEGKLSLSESKFKDMQTGSTVGAVSVLFGGFCALWAQNTRRNTFGWFIIGLFGTVFAVLAVLWHNHYDITHPPSESD